MKNRFLILSLLIFFVALTTFASNSNAMRAIWTLDKMIEKSDVIIIGTVEGTWFDVRPFEDYKIVNTATIRVDEWLKNKQDSDKLEIRYYGDWSQKIENLLGIHRFDTPVHTYKQGEKVLIFASYEKPTMVMGEGHYPFYEGKYVIQDKIGTSQTGEQIQLDVLRKSITDMFEVESSTTKEFESDKKISKEESLPVRLCAYIGFEKYPDNLFTEFLERPYNRDVTFLNFTDSDLKQVPEFYELILQSNQIEYPLNKRAHFVMTSEEILELRPYLEQRSYFEFNHAGQTSLVQNASKDTDGNYRYPEILIGENLYDINGIRFSPIISGQNHTLNVSLEGNLQEIKDSFIERNNPKNPNVIYFEINENDRKPLAVVLDAIEKVQKSKDKIRMSEDVGGKIQDKIQDFFAEQNRKQFNGDDTKHTRYFILNDILYETSFVIC